MLELECQAPYTQPKSVGFVYFLAQPNPALQSDRRAQSDLVSSSTHTEVIREAEKISRTEREAKEDNT